MATVSAMAAFGWQISAHEYAGTLLFSTAGNLLKSAPPLSKTSP
jgi:hypothetical protein